MEPQTVQLLAILLVMGAFALAEIIQGRFFPREATREDHRLDIAMTLLMPAISGGVLLVAGLLCEWLLPEARDALAHWPWWQMLLVLLVRPSGLMGDKN